MTYAPFPVPLAVENLPAFLKAELRRLQTALIEANMASSDYLIEVAKGNVDGASQVLKFGRNEGIGTTVEDIWDNGGTISYLSTAETMEIASTDAVDTSAGTGARTLQIYGVDGDYAKVNETITLNGTTDVTTTNSYLRVYRMKVLTAGSGGVNAGTLTATATTSATVQASITIGYNQTLMAMYTVAANTTAYLYNYYFAINKKTTASADIELFVRPYGGVFQLKHVMGATNTGGVPHHHDFRSPLVIEEKSDIIMRAICSTTAVDISAGFDLLEIT